MDFADFSFDVDSLLGLTATSMGTKRGRDGEQDDFEPECVFESTAKKISLAHEDAGIFAGPLAPASSELSLMYPGREIPTPAAAPSSNANATFDVAPAKDELQPYPFFHYKDFSKVPDTDPLSPLVPPGRVPNFPAKMMAILSRKDLQDIICFMPHGRSWRVLKPREFEVRVIPAYFEHSKYSSFIRQANGWGFRRITQGRDRNSYYHPQFLRGLPHLVKDMKRPGVSEKVQMDPEQEPDLYKISALHPVPEKTESESIDIIHAALKGGPKARVAVCPTPSVPSTAVVSPPSATVSKQQLTPFDQHALAAFQESLGASELQLTKTSTKPAAVPKETPKPQPIQVPQANIATPAPFAIPFKMDSEDKASPLAMAHSMAFADPSVAAAIGASSAASQFAAGFAAAQALSQRQFQAMLASMQEQGLMPKQQG